jgi:hypothetical protein
MGRSGTPDPLLPLMCFQATTALQGGFTVPVTLQSLARQNAGSANVGFGWRRRRTQRGD